MAGRYERFKDDLLIALAKDAETARTPFNPRHSCPSSYKLEHSRA
jgi:hypothetical protein